MSAALAGGCHCGALRFTFETARRLAPRACQCGFCRRHGARSVSDRQGRADLWLGAAAHFYRFATASTDYVLCGRCGVYLGAVAEIGGTPYATLNLNAFDDPRLDLEAVPVSYGGETVQEKAARRLRAWTPATLHKG